MHLTIREVAKIFDVSERVIYGWIRDKGLSAHRIYGRYQFNRTELLEWATTHKVSFSSEILDRFSSDHATTLSAALESGGISYRVEGAHKEEVLKSVVALLKLPASVDRAFLLSVLLAREAMGSTGVGEGIAIPHPRNPIVLQVTQPLVTLCFLAQAIDFGALDGKSVHILFTLISPSVEVHLQLLSRIAFALRNPQFKALLLRQESPEKILGCLKQLEGELPR